MSSLVTRTAKLTPRRGRLRTAAGLATAYTYEPESPEAHGLGGLYVVIEVVIPSRPAQIVVDTIIETVGSQYYNWEPTKPVPALERFERAVKNTNAALAKLVAEGTAGWLGRISAVITLLEGDELHITQTGSGEAFLYRGNVASHITDSSAKSSPKPGSTFGSIASGKVQAGDRLLLATPAVVHAVARAELKSLINDNSAGAAVRKLSEQYADQPEADRIAAIVVEITTADLLAVAPRDDEPETAFVGQGDKPLEVAKAAALPAARKLGETGKTVGQKVVSETSTRLLPRLKASLALGFSAITHDVKNAAGRRRLAMAATVIVVVLAAFAGWQHQQSSTANAVKEYSAAYSFYTKGLDAQQSGDKPAARGDYQKAQKNLEKLAKSANLTKLDASLAKRDHSAEDPASVNKLLAAISDRLDELDGLVRLDGTVVADLARFKNTKPAQVVAAGGKLIVIDANNDSAVYLVDPKSKQVASTEKPDDVGKIIAATVSGNDDGAYIITSEPAVWFIKSLDGSFTRQDISFGDWPKAKSIASYASNLYVLSADGNTVTKHVRTAAGFAAGADYFKDPSLVGGATAIAVDGSIYLGGGSTGLVRYLSGALDAKASGTPDSLAHPSVLQSLATPVLFAFDGTSHRAGLFNNLEKSISFNKQLSFKQGEMQAAAAAADGTAIYAAIGSKIFTAALPQ